MRRTAALYLAGLFVLASFSGCAFNDGKVHPGDTVTPQLEGPIEWSAGQTGNLGIRLYAKGKEEAGSRLLGFGSFPEDTNPTASITFYDGDQVLDSAQVTLSHRC